MAPSALQKAERDRDSIKTTLTWLESKLADHVPNPIPEPKLEIYLNMVTTTHNEVIENHRAICATAPADMTPYNDDYVKLLDALSDLQCGFQEIKKTMSPATTSRTGPSASSTAEIRLPRMELPTFNGNLQDWMPFRDLFLSAVHNNTHLSKAQKLTYLKSVLTGQAANQIKSLSPSDANYDIAWAQLTDRYQNDRELLFVILHRFVGQPNIHSSSAVALRTLIDVSKECVRSLAVLKRPVDQWDDIILFHIFQKLDQSSRELWEQSLKDSSIPSLKSLLEFLEQRARALAAGGITLNKSTKTEGNHQKRVNVHHADANTSSCKLCSSNHLLFKCTKFLAMTVQDRENYAKKSALCVNCLREGHSGAKCYNKGTCRICNQKHHTLLHSKPQESRGNSKEASPLVLNHHSNDETQIRDTLLATAVVKIRDEKGNWHLIRALLDGGSTTSFISESCVRKFGLTRSRASAEIFGLTAASVGTTRGSTSIILEPHFDSQNSYTVNCLILSKVTRKLPMYACDPTVWPHLQELQLADPNYYEPGSIDVLLGSDVFWHSLLDGKRKLSRDAPVGIRSTFGWLVAGNLNSSATKVVVHYADTDLDERLKLFWEIENIPSSKLLTAEEKLCESHFESTHSRDENGRFSVCLPFKIPQPALGHSRDIAVRRYKQVERRLAAQPDNQLQYTTFMKEYLSLGHMEIVPKEEIEQPFHTTCYIPHHFVLKESSTSTKFRVVFDASARTSSGISLNESLMVGPTLQDTLVTILLRFRTHKIAFTADVAKMYRQILVSKADSDMQRIVWRETPNHPMKDYRLLTVTYGTASAPFLATKALQQLARDEVNNFPLAAKVALNDFYVDDLMSGASTEADALLLQSQLLKMTQRGCFDLRKWSSNSSSLLDSIPAEKRETKLPLRIDIDQTIKTLGVSWNPVQDKFLFHIIPAKTDTNDKLTKRKLLSEVAKIFDPLGWLAPIIIRAKIMLQQLWKLTIGWDDPLPLVIQNEWLQFRNNLACIEDISISRCIMTSTYVEIDLVGFCDASTVAYAAVIYLCVYMNNKKSVISLISSKTRVAPLKPISLPRLELCGSAILASLMVTVQESLKISINNTAAYTDSTVVLAWIKSHPSRWKTFVANRVTEIQQLVPSSMWTHVSGNENPADCASRGIDPTELCCHPLWWHGPAWLQNGFRNPSALRSDEMTTDIEIKTNIVCCHVRSSENSLFLYYSSLRTLKRVTAYIFRFYNNCRVKIERKKRESEEEFQTGPLNTCELNNSLLALIRCVQDTIFHKEIHCLNERKPLPLNSTILSLHPFLDESNVLRVGGRLRNAQLSSDQKTPVLLPRQHPFVHLLLMSTHLENNHAGPQLLLSIINQSYWIIRAKDAIRHRIKKCVVCTRHRAATLQQMMGDLPKFRVTPARPFSRCGIDYGGPFILRAIPSRSKVTFKAYLALFVCFTTRAVHLEVVSALTTEAFVAALRRFISRRGRPTDIFSDCGTNFVGAANEMKEVMELVKSSQHNHTVADQLSNNGTQWHFNPPGAPHFGGIWEAGIKSVKFHLNRVIGTTRLTFEELTTVMTQIEATLNSRPLTPFSTDPRDFTALTPGHFLIGAPLTALPEHDLMEEKVNRLSRYEHLQQMNQHFWHRWSNEYLSRLQQRPKWLQQRSEIRINDMVIIKDDRLPPLHWRLGRVIELHPGADGLTRVVSLSTADGQMKRPIVKVCLLPINADDE